MAQSRTRTLTEAAMKREPVAAERRDLTIEVASVDFYSYNRPAYTFWNGFANALIDDGFTQEEALDVLKSKHTRWMLDGADHKIEDLGYKMAGEYLKKNAKEVVGMLADIKAGR